MDIRVDRFFKGGKYTIGRMYIDGVYFCDTLEDKVRDIAECGTGKITHETAIPAGRYTVTLQQSPRFGRLLPYLHDVPHFTGILIHRGNSAADTSGCILVGENKVVGKVINSTGYEVELVARIKAATARGESVKITII